MKSIATLLLTLSLLHASALGAVVFADSFDRPDNRNIDAVLTGITNNTLDALPADAVYTQPWLDPNNRAPTYGVQDGDATNGGGAQILTNQLQLAVGAGTSNAFGNHNFTDAGLLGAGGFTVSLDVTGFAQTGYQQGGAFAIGMSLAEANSAQDAFNLTPGRMTGAFNDASTIGAAVPGVVVSDFWLALRGNNSLAWGGSGGNVMGITGLAGKTGTISATFLFSDFNAGSTVNYEIFLNSVSRGTGSFTWSGTGENYIGLDARDSSGVSLNNFNVSTVPEPSAVVLGLVGLAGLLRRRR